jgi:hypothetical protein
MDEVVEKSVLFQEFIDLWELPRPEDINLFTMDPISIATRILLRHTAREGKSREE